MACEKCVDFGGLWMMTPSGMRRCDCLPPLEPVVSHPPRIVPEEAAVFVEMLAAIPITPGESGTRLAIADELASMCASVEHARWLVQRMVRLYGRWPGVIEMRRVYAAKHMPWDGVRPIGISEFYPDGIPSESEAFPLQLAGPQVRLLEGDRKEEIIEDPKRAEAVRKAAAKMPKMPAATPIGGAFEKHLQEVETPPNQRAELPGPAPQIITQEDVEREVRLLRERREMEVRDGK